MRALALIGSPEALALATRYLASGTARNTRVAAIRTVVARSAGHQSEVAAAVAPLLDTEDDIVVRIAAADALGELKQASSVAALEARRRVEAESRVINTIDAALAKLRGP